MGDAPDDRLLLGAWACLGIVDQGPSHGFAVAARLRPDGDVGRVWSISRPLTYRALDQLVARGFVEAVGEERGIAGGNRTILAVTPLGHQRLRSWLATPVEHVRDLRSELLLKLVLSAPSGVDTAPLLAAQRELAAALERSLREQLRGDPDDLVLRWRTETAGAALRFIESVIAP